MSMWIAPPEMIPTLPAIGDLPAFDAQIRSIRSLGLDASEWTMEQASLVLAARHYADVIMSQAKMRDGHYKQQRLGIILLVLGYPEEAQKVRDWSWEHRQDDDPYDVPNDAMRSAIIVAAEKL